MLFPPPLGCEAHGSANGVSDLKKNVSYTYHINSMSQLRGYMTVLEIVFVGQCKVFVCL